MKLVCEPESNNARHGIIFPFTFAADTIAIDNKK